MNFLPFISFFLLIFAIYINIDLNYYEKNSCDMSYYYISNQISNKIPTEIKKKYKNYKLYEYNDIRINIYNKKYPLLFLHGHLGSYQQARSIFQRIADERSDQMFDYYSIDFNEEPSAYSSNILLNQIEYTTLCMNHILSHYTSNTKLIIIAHSMGGIIAKSLNYNQINTIITLGTPHNKPIIYTDKYMMNIYDSINKIYHNKTINKPRIISISGGIRDILVAYKLSLSNDVNFNGYEIINHSIDHMCLCWCSQLVDLIKDNVISLTNKVNKQIIYPKYYQQHHHLKKSLYYPLHDSLLLYGYIPQQIPLNHNNVTTIQLYIPANTERYIQLSFDNIDQISIISNTTTYITNVTTLKQFIYYFHSINQAQTIQIHFSVTKKKSNSSSNSSFIITIQYQILNQFLKQLYLYLFNNFIYIIYISLFLSCNKQNLKQSLGYFIFICLKYLYYKDIYYILYHSGIEYISILSFIYLWNLMFKHIKSKLYMILLTFISLPLYIDLYYLNMIYNYSIMMMIFITLLLLKRSTFTAPK